MIDIDMEALDGEGVVKLSNADYLTRPLRLAPHEALALIVALRALREVSAPGRARGGRPRARQDRGGGGRGQRPGGRGRPPRRPGRRRRSGPSSRRALRDGRQLDLTYYAPGRDETTERVVDPMRLVFFDGHGYLEGWCHRAEEVRMFRLDRIRERSGARDTRRRRPQGARVSRPVARACSSPTRTTRGGARPRPAGALGGRVLPDRAARRSAPTAAAGLAQVQQRRLAAAAGAAPRRRRHAASSRTTSPTPYAHAPRQALAELRLTASGRSTNPALIGLAQVHARRMKTTPRSSTGDPLRQKRLARVHAHVPDAARRS